MRTEVSILHHDYPQRVRDRIDEKLQHLERFFDRTVSMRAILERQNEDHRVELVANVGHGSVLVVDSRAEVLKAAVDDAVDRMARLLSRHKEKVRDDRRRGARSA